MSPKTRRNLVIAGIVGGVLGPWSAIAQNSNSSADPDAALCVSLPRVAVEGKPEAISDFSTELRGRMMKAVGGPLIKVVPVESRNPRQALAEAAQAHCRSMLTVRFSHNPVSSRGRHSADTALGVADAASSVASSSALGGALSTASSVGSLFGSRSSASSQSSDSFYPVGKGDTVAFDYTLEPVGGNGFAKPMTTVSGKAARDGELLVENLIDKVADGIISAWPPSSQ
jgi:hypothetical protein